MNEYIIDVFTNVAADSISYLVYLYILVKMQFT